MPFSSLYEFAKWHKSIQYRYASSAGRTHDVGHFPPFRCVNTTGPRQQMARKGTHHHIMPSKKESSPSVPTLQCPPDCSSKKFCDPSSCALESVREANAIFDRLRRAA